MGTCDSQCVGRKKKMTSTQIKQEFNISVSSVTHKNIHSEQVNTASGCFPSKVETKPQKVNKKYNEIVLMPSLANPQDQLQASNYGRIRQTKSFTVDDAAGENKKAINTPAKVLKVSKQLEESHTNSVSQQYNLNVRERKDEFLFSPNYISELDNSIVLEHAFSNHSIFIDSNYGYDPEDFEEKKQEGGDINRRLTRHTIEGVSGGRATIKA